MTDKQILAMLEDLVKEVDYYIYKEMFVDKDIEQFEIDRLVEIVKEHLNKPEKKVLQKKVSGRVFVPQTIPEFKKKLKEAGVLNGKTVDHVELSWKLIDSGDIKVEFDFENCSDYTTNNKKFYGFHTLDNGLTFYGAWAGGDWEASVSYIFYWDGKKIRAYVPTEGNPWNTDTKRAFGNDSEADLKNAKKRWPELMEGMTEDDLDCFFDSDEDQMIEDIKKRLVKAEQ